MIKIGESEEYEFHWNYESEEDSRLGVIVGNGEVSFINDIRKVMQKRKHRMFKITTLPVDSPHKDYIDICDFELTPAVSGEETGFANQRMNWVQHYFNFISYMHNKPRSELIPLVTYKPHVEGPLTGYIAAIEQMEDSVQKKLLNIHIGRLKKVKWHYVENEGYVYQIKGANQNERIESLFLGAWSYWFMTAGLEGDSPLNLLVDLDETIIEFPVMNEKRDAVSFVMDSLGKLTFLLHMSLIVKSPTLFPLPETLVNHYLIQNINSKDMNWVEINGFPSQLEEKEAIWLQNQTFLKIKLGIDYQKSL